MPAVDREELHAFLAKQLDHFGGREAHRVALDDLEKAPLRRHQRLYMGEKHRQRPASVAARRVHVQVLFVKYVDRKTSFVIVSQDVQQKQEQAMMYPEFCNVPANSVRVEDRSDHVDDLPQAVAEPSLDAAIN